MTNTVDQPQAKAGSWVTYKRLLRYVAPFVVTFVIATIGFLMAGSAEAYFATVFGDLIDSWEEGWTDKAKLIPIFIFLAALLRGVGEIVGELLLSRISFSVVHNIRTQLFNQLVELPSAYFDANSQGHLVSRITYNVAQLRDTGTDALKSIIQDGGKVIVYVGFMAYMSWQLTLIFIATAPVLALVVGFASRRFRRISRRIQTSMGEVTHVASEMISGYQVVRIFGGEKYEKERFRQSSARNRKQNLKMVVTKAASTQVIQIFVAGALAALIAVLFQSELRGGLSTGNVVTFLGLAGLLARPITKLSNVNAKLQRGLAAAEDIFEQFDQKVECDDGDFEVDRVVGRVEFKDVSFSYVTGNGEVLSGINFTVEPGQTIALVGRSGGGKSTLVSLLGRFYDPDSGQVLIDGVDVQTYSLDCLRKQIALVTQQVTLFNDTLERNIAYGGLADATPEMIAEAVRRAHAEDFIHEMSEGLETVVGDDGVLLSGGQRQRVAIARAMLKDAPILILDEATSSLDTTSERHIQAALEEVMRGRTTFVIAHRLSTIESADQILVVDGGKIVESGTHKELLKLKGSYAALYDAQFGGNDKTLRNKLARSKTSKLPRLPKLNISPASRKSSAVTGWYAKRSWSTLLWPLAKGFEWGVRRRRHKFITGKSSSWRAPVPVIVVGNITVGGTGKSPFVIWLALWLVSQGLKPGIVSRGYGGKAKTYPLQVDATTPAAIAGDEAPMIAARTGCPVVIDPDRPEAVKKLLADNSCDVVISDDGLQHYKLARDVEILLLDGSRGVGNGHCLPAGPLREPVDRAASVDLVLSMGAKSDIDVEQLVINTRSLDFVNVFTRERVDLQSFIEKHENVNAIAGIGNPHRFFESLRSLGLFVSMRAFPDHHDFNASHFVFDNAWPIVMTEKDAIKVRSLELSQNDYFYLEVETDVDETVINRLRSIFIHHGIKLP